MDNPEFVVFYYTVAVLCDSLLFLVALCQHCYKAIIIIIIIIIEIMLPGARTECTLQIFACDQRRLISNKLYQSQTVSCFLQLA